jgi:hypothetical protein
MEGRGFSLIGNGTQPPSDTIRFDVSDGQKLTLDQEQVKSAVTQLALQSVNFDGLTESLSH